MSTNLHMSILQNIFIKFSVHPVYFFFYILNSSAVICSLVPFIIASLWIVYLSSTNINPDRFCTDLLSLLNPACGDTFLFKMVRPRRSCYCSSSKTSLMFPNILSAWEKFPVLVNSFGMTMHPIPALFADFSPRSESSIAMHSSF